MWITQRAKARITVHGLNVYPLVGMDADQDRQGQPRARRPQAGEHPRLGFPGYAGYTSAPSLRNLSTISSTSLPVNLQVLPSQPATTRHLNS